MPLIVLETEINGAIEVCFDLSRSIDLHIISTAHTGEKAVAGKTQGLIELNESVTWRARYLYTWQTLTSQITAFKYPTYFVDEMILGAFKSFRHEHLFRSVQSKTMMTDRFNFESPYGIAGKIFNNLYLTNYMTELLIERNNIIKEYAENGKWEDILRIRKS
ncbi:SRPBCC family protein [Solitalea canadensis]|uniref:Cell division protein n=1 Tax=Solitalea canadensis (strain ATCC 29591 / DSM 3403 / JCM 21819 / LMG 8368 / NBRC 15130 / NCIMB 12057 / USAM 9D) TaxID=929556 RepID=H8KMU3_SOLCM|nr:SRPBCC family protein [Solitalea canadensis]AFD09346.1 hypothetical protein Solca_4356 [Solitalea canadensis DSM 3403]